MKRVISVASTAILISLIAACAGGPSLNVNSLGASSRLLNSGMSEQQVVEVIHAQPRGVDLMTCGGKTGPTWQCKVYRYKNALVSGSLAVYFRQEPDGSWVVNNWSYSDY